VNSAQGANIVPGG